MDRGINKSEGPPLTQFPSGSMFSHVNHTTIPVMEDSTAFKLQPPSDSFNLAVEILNTFTGNRPDKPLPGHPLFDALAREHSTAELQTLSQRLLSLSHILPDTALRELVAFPNAVGKEKYLDAVQPAPTLSPTRIQEDHVAPSSVDPAEQALNRIAHWSKALSSTSPSAATAFQHALTHLAVLGLSSPTPHEPPDAKSIGNDTTRMLGSNIEAINLSCNNQMEIDPVATKNGISMSGDMVHSSASEPQHGKVETCSKVIIRQTADADEHFFKALRRLKVDVSVDTQVVDRRNSMGLVVTPEPSTISLARRDAHWDADHNKTNFLNRIEPGQSSKSATDLAVEEHFEKSLAAFHASNMSKRLLSHHTQTSASGSGGSMVQLPETDQTNCINVSTTASTTTTTTTPKSSSLNYDLQHSMTKHRHKTPCLMRQYSQDQTGYHVEPAILPLIEPHLSRSVTSPESVTQNSNDPVMAMLSESNRNRTTCLTTRLPDKELTRLQQQFASATAEAAAAAATAMTSTGSVHTPTVAVNSFKPKKNWLAQYDWQPDARGTNATSPIVANGLAVDSPGSAESSPLSSSAFSREQSDGLTSNTLSWSAASPRRSRAKLPRANSAQEHEVSVQTTESIGLSTEDRPPVDRRVRHSAEIQTDIGLTPVLSSLDADEEGSSADEAFSGITRPRKILLLENNGDDQTISRSVPEQVKCGELLKQSGHSASAQVKRSAIALRKDLALSPICQEHTGSGTILLAKSNSSGEKFEDRILTDPSDRFSPKLMEDQLHILNHNVTTSNNNNEIGNNNNNSSSNNNKNRQNPKSCSHCGLSNSCSPSPAHQDGSATSAVTPVSGTTSGFFTGSTYSLDSSVGPTHALPFDSREVDSGIDLKSVSEERSFTDGQHGANLNDSSGQTHEATDLPICLWGMRKRASSEASPWSTLKRSRSVLTSPLSGRANCASCSSSSAELLLEAHGAVMISEDPTDGSNRFRCTDSNGAHRCRSDGGNRSLTPEFNGSNARERLLTQSRQNSDPIEVKLPEDEAENDERTRSVPPQLTQTSPMCKHSIACDRKPASEPPPVISKHTSFRNAGRSLSDAASIPTLHLKKENEVFVLR